MCICLLNACCFLYVSRFLQLIEKLCFDMKAHKHNKNNCSKKHYFLKKINCRRQWIRIQEVGSPVIIGIALLTTMALMLRACEGFI